MTKRRPSERTTAPMGRPPAPGRRRRPWRAAVALVVILLLTAVALFTRYRVAPGWRRGHASRGAPSAEFVGRGACTGCHAREDSLWRGSHHALAMEPASAATVLGDFRDARFTHFGVTSTFATRDGKFFAHTDGPDGALHDYEIAFTFGVYPLQQYLIAFPGGRFQALNVAWDARPAAEGGQRWFHLYPAEAVPHDDILHWTGPYQNWNFMCAECHSTNVSKGYDPASDTYRTTYSEVDVSCEACHGPASAHVAWARALGADTARAVRGDAGLAVPLLDTVPASWIVDSATGIARRSALRTSTAEVEACGRCHARRSVIADPYEPGRPLADTHRPALLQDPLYFADGQIRDEVYEYGSFRQSRMYRAGVTCTDCHDPHRATIEAPGDAACARCHAPAKFAAPAHTHHRPNTPGSSCVRCHMPTRDYMVVHARHDHSIRIPRPDLTLALGTPNACSGCHRDRTPQWAATASARWWTKRAGEPQFGQSLALGRRAARGADAALIALAGDSAQPAIARATAVELLARAPGPKVVSALQRALWDPDPLVRGAGVGGASRLAGPDRAAMLAPLLSDPARLVRVDAARALAALPPSLIPEDRRADLARGLDEYRAELRANGDRAEAQLALGAFFAETGKLDSAEAAYERALRLNPWLIAAYVNVADLRRQQGRDAEAEGVLRRGLAYAPKGAGAELQYALGLTLVREQRTADALAPLAAAAALAPDEARYALVFALALQQLGRLAEARDVLARALALHPDDRDLANAYVSVTRPAGGR